MWAVCSPLALFPLCDFSLPGCVSPPEHQRLEYEGGFHAALQPMFARISATPSPLLFPLVTLGQHPTGLQTPDGPRLQGPFAAICGFAWPTLVLLSGNLREQLLILVLCLILLGLSITIPASLATEVGQLDFSSRTLLIEEPPLLAEKMGS